MVFTKRCRICKKPVKEEFHFCPYCGEYLRSEKDFFNKLERIIEEEFERIEKLLGFAIPKIKIYPKSVSEQESKPGEDIREEIAVKKVEEPKIEEVEKNGEKIIKIKLPGVKEERNIEIIKLEESIEIRARCGNKIYFKIIPVPPKKIYRKDFKNEELVLLVSK